MTRDLHTSAYADISLTPARDESHEGCSTETEGFEPTRATNPHAFQACALSHSAKFPNTGQVMQRR
jgi:hypothetical protein